MEESETYQDATLPNAQRENEPRGVRIKIIGVGGAGNNAVDRLKLNNLGHVHLACVNTDSKTLSASPVEETLMIGRSLTRGLSAGGEVEIGRQAAEMDSEHLRKLVRGIDLVFIVAGLGGGTGSGAAPVLARICEEEGAVSVAFVTLPFTKEGSRRAQQAEDALAELRTECHAVIPLPNDLLLQQIEEQATLLDAFALADEWINRGVRAIWSMLFQNGLINVDFANLRRAFEHRGAKTLFGIGRGEGPDAAKKALKSLDLCPLLHLPETRYLRRADSLIVNIIGGPGLSMDEVSLIMDHICQKFGSRDETVLGAVVDGAMGQAIEITVIGTTAVDGARPQYRAPRKMARKPVSVPAAAVPEVTPAVRAEWGRKARAQREADKHNSRQLGFDFPAEAENRGFFQDCERDPDEGEDLDIPTFLRKGIRIQLQ